MFCWVTVLMREITICLHVIGRFAAGPSLFILNRHSFVLETRIELKYQPKVGQRYFKRLGNAFAALHVKFDASKLLEFVSHRKQRRMAFQ